MEFKKLRITTVLVVNITLIGFSRGPFISALDKTWCPDHFMCANPSCRTPLISIGFVEEEGQLYCEGDYEKYFAPRCGKCGRAIVGVSWNEFMWLLLS